MVSSFVIDKEINREYKLCAAVSVFKSLYDGKKDVQDVLSVFISFVIENQSLTSFTSYDIKKGLYDEFYFDIPESVIKSIIRKRLKLKINNGIFVKEIDNTVIINKEEINSQLDEANQNNKIIMDDLLRFAEEKTEHTLNQDERNDLTAGLYNFLMNKSIDNKYAHIVSAYIINIEPDILKSKIVSNIREGIIIYEGIKYTSDVNEIARWDKNLTVFCDVDILFSLYGLNGTIYKELILDLLKLVNESNIKAKGKIQLCYFSKTKQEIDSYYNKAEAIFETGEAINPSKNAMISIINGCKKSSDIVQKKNEFYSFLRRMYITEYKKQNSFYNEDNRDLVLTDSSIINMVTEKFSGTTTNYANECFDYINFINILRNGERILEFEKSEYIFLTSNRKTLFIAYSLIPDDVYEISRAINPDYLINKLWFKLNKGFGDRVLSSFNIISKAKIILSTQLNSRISDDYDEIYAKLESGAISSDAAVDTLVELKSVAKRPEDLSSDNIDNSLEYLLSEDSIEERIYQNKVLEVKYNETQDQLVISQQEITNKDTLIQTQGHQIEVLEKELENIRCKNKADELKKQERRKKIGRVLRSLLCISIVIALIWCIVRLDIGLDEIAKSSISWIVGIIGTLITVLSFFGIDIRTIKDFIKRNKK